jgi:hypothetical protein
MGILLTVLLILAIAAVIIAQQKSYRRGCVAQRKWEESNPPRCPMCDQPYHRLAEDLADVAEGSAWSVFDDTWSEPCHCKDGFSHLKKFFGEDSESRTRLRQFLEREEQEEKADTDYDPDVEEDPVIEEILDEISACRRWFFQQKD